MPDTTSTSRGPFSDSWPRQSMMSGILNANNRQLLNWMDHIMGSLQHWGQQKILAVAAGDSEAELQADRQLEEYRLLILCMRARADYLGSQQDTDGETDGDSGTECA